MSTEREIVQSELVNLPNHCVSCGANSALKKGQTCMCEKWSQKETKIIFLLNVQCSASLSNCTRGHRDILIGISERARGAALGRLISNIKRAKSCQHITNEHASELKNKIPVSYSIYSTAVTISHHRLIIVFTVPPLLTFDRNHCPNLITLPLLMLSHVFIRAT